MANELVTIEEELTPVKLKEFKKGDDGQFITLVDIEHTKDILRKLARKYNRLNITRENWKKEGLEAERILRNSRYALQKIHKSNNKFLNDVKKKERELYEGLISIIKPIEEKLKGKIDEIKEEIKREREEAERKERERLEKIENKLKDYEFDLEKILVKGRTKEDLEVFDKKMSELKDDIEKGLFEEFEFKAKRLEAIHLSKRRDLVLEIESREREERERIEFEERKRAEAEKRMKIFEYRKRVLIEDKGLTYKNDLFLISDYKVEVSKINEFDEIEWFEFIKFIDKKKEDLAKEKELKISEGLKELKNEFNDTLIVFEGLGGDKEKWNLKDGEYPTEKMIKDLKDEVKELQKRKKQRLIDGVTKEMEFFKEKTLSFISELENDYKNYDFRYAESKSIIGNLINSIKKSTKQIIG